MKYKRIVACDTETTGLDVYNGDRPFMFSFTEGEDSWYYSGKVDPFTREVTWDADIIELIKHIWEDENVIKILHNAAFDIGMAASVGVKCVGTYFDTIIVSHCADSGRPTFALKPLCKSLFGN